MKTIWISGLGAVLGLASAAAAAEPGQRPVFVGTPYELTVHLSPTVNSFSFSGSAYDPDPSDIVTILGGGFTTFTRFSTVRGNPASFTLAGIGLTSKDSGTYEFDLYASDNSLPLVSTTLLTVHIIPEPTTAVVCVAGFAGARRRRPIGADFR